VFPHHEAEIAQAEAATGVKPLVRFWVHSGLLMIRGERMGHSMGNFVTIEETLKQHDAEALRLYYGMRHYRSQLNYDEADIRQAEEVLDKLRSTYNQFRTLRDSGRLSDDKLIDPNIEQLTSKAVERFNVAMDDDFNTPRALAELIGYAKSAEAYVTGKITRTSAELIIGTFDYFGRVFGILRRSNARQSNVVEKVLSLLVRMREDARKRGDWTTADRIRDELTQAGVGLEDTPSGARWYLASATNPVKKSS
jgi:cysteinyl-tRNA synthetase